MLVPDDTDAVGALATGRSEATEIVRVAESDRPQFRPVTRIWYVPGRAVDGAVTRTDPALAVQPNRLGVFIVAVQPDGTPLTEKLTRSKKVELRVSENGTFTEPPWDEMDAPEPAFRLKFPRLPIRATFSSGS